eukprot:jgi/Mesen1/7136/ME000037S06497
MGSTELDMSLDDIIKSNKATRGGGRGGRSARGGGGRGAGPARRNVNRAAYRPSPYGLAKPSPMATDAAWQHDLYENGAAAGVGAPGGRAIETGTKLYISNLDFGVSNEDIKELFSEIGDLKRSSVHYDRSGRSKGTAEVVFARRADGVAALSRYNNVQLDGKPMRIEIIGTNLAAPVAARVRTVPGFVAATAAAGPVRGGRGFARGAGRGGRGGGRGRGGRKGGNKPEKTQEELDAELDSYHASKDEAPMQS